MPLDLGQALLGAVEVFFVVAVGVYSFAYEQKFGHLPTTLTLSAGRLVSTYRWLWGMRQRHYDASEIISVDLVPVPDIFRRRGVFMLTFRRRRGLNLSFRLSNRDPGLPERGAQAFRRELKLPNARA
jgi:hypothetical protein